MTIKDIAINNDALPQSADRGAKWLAFAGLTGALAASSCCVVPILLFSLGISGAWIGNLTQLAPYKPLFVVATVCALGAGYWLTWRASQRACAEGEACARPLPNRVVLTTLVAATVIVIGAFAFDYVAPLFLQ